MTKANYSLRLQPSLKAAAERLAEADGTSLNQFINVAVAESCRRWKPKRFSRRGPAKPMRWHEVAVI